MTFTITTESGEQITTESGTAITTDGPIQPNFQTPLSIIILALKTSGVLGVGQTPLAEDVNDAFTLLNFMMSQWNNKRWLIYHLLDVSYPSNGSQFYTVGPGQQFDCNRPDRLEAAFFRQLIPSTPNQIDYPLEIISARETYNDIALKSLTSFPSYIFYDSAYPIGYVYPWPLPQANLYSVHITIKESLSKFRNLTQKVNLPEEYNAALLYNLAVRLRPMYQMPPDPTLLALAKDALAVIRGSNTQIPRLQLPRDLNRGGIYNFYSDTMF